MNRPVEAVSLALAIALCGAAAAQDVTVARTQVRADIRDGAATTTIEQTFANRGQGDAEAVWCLPLPPGANADGLKLRLGDRELDAEVLDAAAARGVYEQIVRRRRDPALLEYVGDGLLQARVFPIPAGGEATLSVRLRQSLPLTGGLGEWSVPLRALRLSVPHTGPIGVDVSLRTGTALRTVVPSRPDAEVRFDGECAARVTFELGADAACERDLRVLFGLAASEFGLHAQCYRRDGDDGFFELFVSPRRSLPAELLPPRCVQFVLDTSGSMKPQKLAQAKTALRAFLATLRPQDRFQIVPFATDARPFFPAPRRAEFQALAQAMRRIDELEARGGTNIEDALRTALAGARSPAGGGDDVAPAPNELSLIVFVTDGRPTVGETGARQLLRRLAEADDRRTRVFVFGVGDDVHRELLLDIAREHRGSCDLVVEGEPIDRQTAALCARIREPALCDVTVECDGLERFELAPRTVPDLFAGDTLRLVGRYRGTGTHEVVLRGTLAGAVQEYHFDVAFPTVDLRDDAVPVAWAQRQIDELLAAERRAPNRELVDEIGRLARAYGITTPYTSQLIVEEGVRLGGTKRGPCAPSRAFAGPGGPAAPGPSTGGPGTAGSDGFHLGGRGPATRTAPPPTRRAAGRTFLQVGAVWLETGLPDDWAGRCRRVVAFGDEYFAVLRAHPELRAAFALGAEVVLRVDDGIVRVVADS